MGENAWNVLRWIDDLVGVLHMRFLDVIPPQRQKLSKRVFRVKKTFCGTPKIALSLVHLQAFFRPENISIA